MRRLAAVTALVLGTTGALVFIAPSAYAATTTCEGTIANQTVESVEVPHHANCVLQNVTVKKNVKAVDAGDLDIFNSTIKGNLVIDDSAGFWSEFVISCTTVKGSVKISNIEWNDELSLDGGRDEGTCGPNLVTGSVTYANNAGEVDLERTTVGGTVTAKGNYDISFEGNTIYRDRLCSSNSTVNLDDPPDVVYGTDTCTA